FHEIVSRSEVDALGTFGIARHEGEVTDAFCYSIGHLPGIVIDPQRQRQLQCAGETPYQINSDAFYLAFVVLDSEKSGSRRRCDYSATQLSCRRQLFEVVCTGHGISINTRRCGRLWLQVPQSRRHNPPISAAGIPDW